MNKNRGLFLVKRDDSQVALYQDNNEIGFVSNDLKPGELHLRAKASEITYHQEIFYAQLLFFKNCPDNHNFPRLVSEELLDDSHAKELQGLKTILRKKLITITGIEFFNLRNLSKA